MAEHPFKFMAKIKKERDLECHVRLGRIFGDEYVEIHDYIPSEDVNLPGFVVNTKYLGQLTEVLEDISRQISWSRHPSTSQCEGQGQLF